VVGCVLRTIKKPGPHRTHHYHSFSFIHKVRKRCIKCTLPSWKQAANKNDLWSCLWNRYLWYHPPARRKSRINNRVKSVGLPLSLTAMELPPAVRVKRLPLANPTSSSLRTRKKITIRLTLLTSMIHNIQI